MTGNYTLKLSDVELRRYRMMADNAVCFEGDAWRRSGIVPGAQIADVGCGPGIMLVEFARQAAPQGSVVGIDQSQEARDAARALVEATGTSNARVQVGQADDTGLEADSMDVVVMRHVLLHNGPRALAILGHLSSRLRPGGCLYLVETDITARRWENLDPDIEDLIERWCQMLTQQGNDLAIGPHLGALVLEAGLEIVAREAHFLVVPYPPPEGGEFVRPPEWAAGAAMIEAGLATPGDVERWDRAFRRREQSGVQDAVYVPFFAITARRPIGTPLSPE